MFNIEKTIDDEHMKNYEKVVWKKRYAETILKKNMKKQYWKTKKIKKILVEMNSRRLILKIYIHVR